MRPGSEAKIRMVAGGFCARRGLSVVISFAASTPPGNRIFWVSMNHGAAR
jgi:hypothetical protein